MEAVKLGLQIHEPNLIHYTLHGKWKRRWLLFLDLLNRKPAILASIVIVAIITMLVSVWYYA